MDLNTGQRTQVGKLHKAGERTPTVIREVTMILNCPLKSEAIMGDAQLSTDDRSPDFIPGLKKKKKKKFSIVVLCFLFKVDKVLQTCRERKYSESIHHFGRSLSMSLKTL